MKVSVTGTAKKLIADAKNFEKIQNQAQVASTNRVAQQAKRVMNVEVRSTYEVKSSAVNKASRVSKANYRNPVAKLIIKGARLALSSFKHRKTMKGTVVKIRKDKKTLIPGAFPQLMPQSGHKGIFLRMKGWTHKLIKESPNVWHGLKIKQLRTLSLSQMAKTVNVKRKVQAFVEKKWPERYEYEMKRRQK